MKRILAVAILMLGLGVSASAKDFTLAVVPDPQTGGHDIALSWTLSVGVGVINQNVYRANCTGTVTAGVCSTDGTATFAKLATGTALGPAITTFTDSTVAAGQSYIYYITAVCPATGACQGESVPSAHIAGTIPGNTPPPPTGLSITTVAINRQGTQDRLQADWTDTNGAATAFTIFGGMGQVLKQGSQTAANGVYSFAILIPPQSGVFSVCDATPNCVSAPFQGI